MRNSGFLNTFIAILSATIFFYGFSSIGALALNNVVSTSFTERTFVGPFDISGQNEQTAKGNLNTHFAKLNLDFDVTLTYQDATVPLPLEVVFFDVNKTVEQVASGEDNAIIASVSIDGLRTVLIQKFSPIHFTDASVEAIVAGIEQELQTGIMPLNVHITDYIHVSSILENEIAKSTVAIQHYSTSFNSLIDLLHGTTLAPLSTFSLLDSIQTNNLGHISDEELTVLASVIYASILQTNFTIDERNIGNMLTSSVEPGFEAAINKQYGLNFVFTNPNKTAFTLQLQSSSGAVESAIVGMPLLHSYEPYVENVETFMPKTVKQFSAFVPTGQIRVENEGRDGMEVDVYRVISFDGSVISDEMISSDFYSPLSKIELHPLEKEVQQTDLNTETDEIDDGLKGNQDSAGSPSSEDESSDESGTPPSQKEDDDEIQYDKGGNLVN